MLKRNRGKIENMGFSKHSNSLRCKYLLKPTRNWSTVGWWITDQLKDLVIHSQFQNVDSFVGEHKRYEFVLNGRKCPVGIT